MKFVADDIFTQFWAALAWLGMMFVSEMWIQLLYLPSTAQQYSASFRSRLQNTSLLASGSSSWPVPEENPPNISRTFDSTAAEVREIRVAPVLRSLHAVLASNHVLRSFWTW